MKQIIKLILRDFKKGKITQETAIRDLVQENRNCKKDLLIDLLEKMKYSRCESHIEIVDNYLEEENY